MKAFVASAVGLALVALAQVGCGANSSRLAACAPGETRSCACPSGWPAVEICTAAGTFAACDCADGGLGGGAAGRNAAGAGAPAGGSRGDAGTAGGAAAGAAGGAGGAAGANQGGAGQSDPPPETGCVPSGRLIRGTETLIDLFPIAAGILVVRGDAILLLGRDGTVQRMVPAARPILSAAFDGKSLVVADAALITVFSPALDSRGTVLLTEGCVSSVLLDDGVFVCGPANDWDRVFYTYDINAMRPIATSSQKFTYHGRPMRRVPGSRSFVTVTTDSSPSDFYLYQVLPGGTDVVYVNESPYHGDFAATTTIGFDTTPATHLVQTGGLLLRIFGDGCDGQHNSFTSGCFVKDGSLGLLPATQSYLALGNDDAGRLFAVINDGSPPYYAYSALCPGGCTVQRIDVPSRTVVAQRKHQMASRRFVALRPDPGCKMVALGYELATSTSPVEYSGYQIDLVDYGEK